MHPGGRKLVLVGQLLQGRGAAVLRVHVHYGPVVQGQRDVLPAVRRERPPVDFDLFDRGHREVRPALGAGHLLVGRHRHHAEAEGSKERGPVGVVLGHFKRGLRRSQIPCFRSRGGHGSTAFLLEPPGWLVASSGGSGMFGVGLLLRLLAEEETEEPLALGNRHGARVSHVHQAAPA